MNLYNEKEQTYYTNPRLDIISLLPRNGKSRILEIGAGGGDTLVEIKKSGLAAEVVGVELFDMPKTQQQHPSIDKFIIGNIETTELDLPYNYFDIIICGDVLEHLFDPWSAVEKLKKYLKTGGLFIVSMPNVREYRVLSKIIFKGDFKYEDAGILDKTHIKFFCKKNILDLLSNAGLKILKVNSTLDFAYKNSRKYYFNLLTRGLFEEFLVIQYVVTAEKSI